MSNNYFPPAESKGGWRLLSDDDEIRALGGMEPWKLDRMEAMQNQMNGGYEWQIAIIRNGCLVREVCSYNVQQTMNFSVCSCTKSITSLAFGLLFEDSSKGLLGDVKIDMESYAYDFIPDAFPLSDPRKKDMKIKHLLSMTSGIAGESLGYFGVPYDGRHGVFEYMYGKASDRNGRFVSELVCEPGGKWDYCDPGFCHLAVIFKNASGKQMNEYTQERLFAPIGVEGAAWDMIGGSGFIGPYTGTAGWLHLSAREIARVGYLTMKKGKWGDEQIVPLEYIAMATVPSQDLNRDYGYGFWTNNAGECWPYLPKDTYAMMGHNSNKCYIIPSLDMVVARVGNGPYNWHEPNFITSAVDCVIK